jgi:hypothetical protein
MSVQEFTPVGLRDLLELNLIHPPQTSEFILCPAFDKVADLTAELFLFERQEKVAQGKQLNLSFART